MGECLSYSLKVPYLQCRGVSGPLGFKRPSSLMPQQTLREKEQSHPLLVDQNWRLTINQRYLLLMPIKFAFWNTPTMIARVSFFKWMDWLWNCFRLIGLYLEFVLHWLMKMFACTFILGIVSFIYQTLSWSSKSQNCIVMAIEPKWFSQTRS